MRSTLDDIDLSGDRRTGKSIRQIDHAIQILYKYKIVDIKDHHENGKCKHANRILFNRVRARLEMEHRYLDSINYFKLYNRYNGEPDRFVIEIVI